MQKEDWAVATRNLIQLLRPGGAIQWEENDAIGSRCVRGGKAGTSHQNLALLTSPMAKIYYERFRCSFDIVPEVFVKAGLQGVVQDVVSTDRVIDTRKVSSTLGIQTIALWVQNLKKAGQQTDFWPGHQIDDLVRKATEDVDNGAYLRYDIGATIGFKPQ